MFSITVTDADGITVNEDIPTDEAVLGKGKSCAVRLAGWRVGREHAKVVLASNGLHIEGLGQLSGTWVNGVRVLRHGPLDFSDEIHISGYKIRIKDRAAKDKWAGVPVTHDDANVKSIARPDFKAQNSLYTPEEIDAIRSRFQWRKGVHERLLETIDLRRRDLMRLSDAELRSETQHRAV